MCTLTLASLSHLSLLQVSYPKEALTSLILHPGTQPGICQGGGGGELVGKLSTCSTTTGWRKAYKKILA